MIIVGEEKVMGNLLAFRSVGRQAFAHLIDATDNREAYAAQPCACSATTRSSGNVRSRRKLPLSKALRNDSNVPRSAGGAPGSSRPDPVGQISHRERLLLKEAAFGLPRSGLSVRRPKSSHSEPA